jgi:K+-sensing histidine kinase KdpD
MNTKGIGLGLVISEQIVKQFNGEMGFESEPNFGSTFRFSFMLEDDKNEEEEDNAYQKDFNINSNKLEFKW